MTPLQWLDFTETFQDIAVSLLWICTVENKSYISYLTITHNWNLGEVFFDLLEMKGRLILVAL